MLHEDGIVIRKTEGGDLLLKWWGVLVIMIGGASAVGVAHYRVGLNDQRITEERKDRTTENAAMRDALVRAMKDHQGGQHAETREDADHMRERLTRQEERLIQVQEDVLDLRTEQRAGFERIEDALRVR